MVLKYFQDIDLRETILKHLIQIYLLYIEQNQNYVYILLIIIIANQNITSRLV